MHSKPNVVISKCIEHGHCRYDGSMIGSEFVREMMPFVNFMPLCPEMDIGLPSPRESLRLADTGDGIRLLSYVNGTDRTDEMQGYAEKTVKSINTFHPDGFMLKSRSPSCGIKDVKVYGGIGKAPPLPIKERGIFGGFMIDSYPYLPIEDEGRLLNFTIREHYYTVIFTLADFRENVMNGNMKSLIDFHSKNKYLLMAYSQTGLKKLGSIAANHGKKSFADLIKEYSSLLYSTLSTKPSRGRYINVMLHILGYFKNELSSAEKALFLDLLEQYRNSRIPQSSVFTLLGSWGVRFDARYLTDQTIFRPFPVELATVLDSGKGR